MHRTVNVALVVGVLLALVSAGAATSATMPEPRAARWHPPLAAIGPVEAPGPQPAGVVERITGELTYLDQERSRTFRFPGAGYVKVHLRRLALLPGDYVTVADPAGAEVYRYQPVGGEWPAGGVWATSVTGDTAVVTLHRGVADDARAEPPGVDDRPGRADQPGAATLDRAPAQAWPWLRPGVGQPGDSLRGLTGLGVLVDQVARGLRPSEVVAGGADGPAGGPSGREESLCGGDDSLEAVCYESSHPTIYRNSQAVVQILVEGVKLCTAFRVGPRNRLLTNYHCLRTEDEARQTEVWFNYQCETCEGGRVLQPTKVRAAEVLAGDPLLDFTLFTVDDFDRVAQYGYLTLADRPAEAGEEIYVPQHPMGFPGRVALRSDADPVGTCVVADPRAHGYQWYSDISYYCDTNSGSSGAPVLSRSDHQVIGLHHFGGCPNGGVRIDLIRPRIADLL